ncbi:MAG: hypothetical protein AAF561_04095 [Planctomycetota bacterium]
MKTRAFFSVLFVAFFVGTAQAALFGSANGVSITVSVNPVDGRVVVETDGLWAGLSIRSERDAFLPDNLPWFADTPQSGAIVLNETPLTLASVLAADPGSFAIGTTGAAYPAGTFDLGLFVDPARFDVADFTNGNFTAEWLTDFNEVQPLFIFPEPSSSATIGLSAALLLRRRRSA